LGSNPNKSIFEEIMPKIATGYTEGRYYPKILTKEQVKEYEVLGYKPIDISEEVLARWEQHCQEIISWNVFWQKIENEIWCE
jgi:hypothetical protein